MIYKTKDTKIKELEEVLDDYDKLYELGFGLLVLSALIIGCTIPKFLPLPLIVIGILIGYDQLLTHRRNIKFRQKFLANLDKARKVSASHRQ